MAFAVGASGLHGLGLIAKTRIGEGCIIMRASESGSETIGVNVDISPTAFKEIKAKINHSCVPNAKFTESGELTVVRIVDCDEEITINYLDIDLPLIPRRAALMNTFGFKCTCPACAPGHRRQWLEGLSWGILCRSKTCLAHEICDTLDMVMESANNVPMQMCAPTLLRACYLEAAKPGCLPDWLRDATEMIKLTLSQFDISGFVSSPPPFFLPTLASPSVKSTTELKCAACNVTFHDVYDKFSVCVNEATPDFRVPAPTANCVSSWLRTGDLYRSVSEVTSTSKTVISLLTPKAIAAHVDRVNSTLGKTGFFNPTSPVQWYVMGSEQPASTDALGLINFRESLLFLDKLTAGPMAGMRAVHSQLDVLPPSQWATHPLTQQSVLRAGVLPTNPTFVRNQIWMADLYRSHLGRTANSHAYSNFGVYTYSSKVRIRAVLLNDPDLTAWCNLRDAEVLAYWETHTQPTQASAFKSQLYLGAINRTGFATCVLTDGKIHKVKSAFGALENNKNGKTEFHPDFVKILEATTAKLKFPRAPPPGKKWAPDEVRRQVQAQAGSVGFDATELEAMSKSEWARWLKVASWIAGK